MSDDLSVEEWLAVRRAEAKFIEPATAELFWNWGDIVDPYGTDTDFPEEHKCLDRLYFARRPGRDIWVCFFDLPNDVRDELWQRLKREPQDDELPF